MQSKMKLNVSGPDYDRLKSPLVAAPCKYIYMKYYSQAYQHFQPFKGC